jgi:hypothetical protein
MYTFAVHYLLGNIPAWVWPAAAGAAAMIYFLSGILTHIPECKPYAVFLKPVSGIVMVFSVFMYGGSGVVAVYQQDLKDAQQQMKLLQQQSDAANVQLTQALKANENLIKGHSYGVRQQAEQNRVVINKECTINDVAFATYNRAVKNQATTGFVTVGTPK